MSSSFLSSYMRLPDMLWYICPSSSMLRTLYHMSSSHQHHYHAINIIMRAHNSLARAPSLSYIIVRAR